VPEAEGLLKVRRALKRKLVDSDRTVFVPIRSKVLLHHSGRRSETFTPGSGQWSVVCYGGEMVLVSARSGESWLVSRATEIFVPKIPLSALLEEYADDLRRRLEREPHLVCVPGMLEMRSWTYDVRSLTWGPRPKDGEPPSVHHYTLVADRLAAEAWGMTDAELEHLVNVEAPNQFWRSRLSPALNARGEQDDTK
jgi:hypothetical protein